MPRRPSHLTHTLRTLSGNLKMKCTDFTLELQKEAAGDLTITFKGKTDRLMRAVQSAFPLMIPLLTQMQPPLTKKQMRFDAETRDIDKKGKHGLYQAKSKRKAKPTT